MRGVDWIVYGHFNATNALITGANRRIKLLLANEITQLQPISLSPVGMNYYRK